VLVENMDFYRNIIIDLLIHIICELKSHLAMLDLNNNSLI